MRKLASIQRILSLKPIEGADKIEVATCLGWHVVVQKGLYKVGDPVIYVEVDSILPEKPEFEFMRPRHFKVKTIKLRGQVSQGMVFPLSFLNGETYPINYDVTDILGITKYEPELPMNLRGKTRSPYRYKYDGLPDWFYSISRKVLSEKLFKKYLCVTSGLLFPDFIHKTDETRVQNLQTMLNLNQGTLCYIAEKVDGSSITIYLKDGRFGVCSRNVDLKEEVGNTFWDTVRALDIERKMREFGKKYNLDKNFALQGELLGEGIQGNKLKIKGHTIRFFNVFNITKQEYCGYDAFISTINELGLETVPILSIEYVLGNNIDDIVKMSEGKSVICPTTEREGVVIRSMEGNRFSFKAINPRFLLKFQE